MSIRPSVYKGQKVRPYRIGENRNKIAKISGGKLIARMAFDFRDGLTFEAFHTPVPAALTRYCEKSLDSLRHAQNVRRSQDDPWWREIREGLVDHYRMAWVSCQGSLLVPPLWNGNGKRAHPLIIEASNDNRIFLERMQGSIGEHFDVHVEYFEKPPASWVCDL